MAFEQVRQHYLDGMGGEPVNIINGPFRISILADENVLTQPDLANRNYCCRSLAACWSTQLVIPLATLLWMAHDASK